MLQDFKLESIIERPLLRVRLEIQGIVQGVGFRPFIFTLAKRFCLFGFVQNVDGVVVAELEGAGENIGQLVLSLQSELPKLAVIEDLKITETTLQYDQVFQILDSRSGGDSVKILPADVGLCDDCVEELYDPTNRRFNYPLINCISCGPRFSIVSSFPYDRERTSMTDFEMCESCRKEYQDPADRRYHAQPISCPSCGPRMYIKDAKGKETDAFSIDRLASIVDSGQIVAIKGVGSFHLCCNALDPISIKNLRARKKRGSKPFALLAKNCEVIENYCHINKEDKKILLSSESPIVLLPKKNSEVLMGIAPENPYVGFMLPSNPLYKLLIDHVESELLVMTSANIASEPAISKDDDAFFRLGDIADYFVGHNREIQVRTDDSLVRVEDGKPYFFRRSRGWAPRPLKFDHFAEVLTQKNILAMGGQLKNTFAINKNEYMYLGQHIGDLFSLGAYTDFKKSIEFSKKQFDLEPQLIACDMHPGYYPTQLAEEQAALPIIKVQHHHAHMAACMADNNLNETVIGVCFDGSGYGPDQTIWGGEFLIGNFQTFKRAAHFSNFPLITGEKSFTHIWRIALGILKSFDIDYYSRLWPKEEVTILENQISHSVFTSSVGRIFDAAASLIGDKLIVDHEAQGPQYLESLAMGVESSDFYNINLEHRMEITKIPTGDLFSSLVKDMKLGIDKPLLAKKFHNSLIEASLKTCLHLRNCENINKVVLSGGVFLNSIMLKQLRHLLMENDFEVFHHNEIPCNDGGLSVGQLMIAAHQGV